MAHKVSVMQVSVTIKVPTVRQPTYLVVYYLGSTTDTMLIYSHKSPLFTL